MGARAGFVLLVLLIALFAAGKAVLFDTLDPDCFWHLRVADQLLHDGIGPLVDRLSFVSSRQAWTPYSWLAELGMRSIWNAGGFRAAVAVQAALQGAIVLAMSGCCLQFQARFGAERRYLAAAVATAGGAFLSLPYLSFRPVTAALLVLWIIAFLVQRDQALGKKTRAVWLALPLTVLLTNLHLFSLLVPVVLLALAVGEAIDDQRRVVVRRYLLLSAGTAVAFCLTPMLPGLVRTAFFYSTQDSMVAGPAIAEMQSFTRGPMGVLSAAIVATAVTLCLIGRDRVRAGDWLCIAGGAVLLLKLGRFAPVFAIAIVPPLSAVLPRLSDRAMSRPSLWFGLCTVLVLASGRIVVGFPGKTATLSTWLNRQGPGAPGYPCEAADFVDQHVPRSTGHLLNEFSWGGYLAWRLGERYQVLLDGRTQVYPADVWQATTLGSDAELQRYLAKLPADAALFGGGSARFQRVLENLRWTVVHRDERACVMVPPAAGLASVRD